MVKTTKPQINRFKQTKIKKREINLPKRQNSSRLGIVRKVYRNFDFVYKIGGVVLFSTFFAVLSQHGPY